MSNLETIVLVGAFCLAMAAIAVILLTIILEEIRDAVGNQRSTARRRKARPVKKRRNRKV